MVEWVEEESYFFKLSDWEKPLFELLKKHKLDHKKVAVELNGSIINKKKYKQRFVKNNDKIEIVHFIGGG